MINEKTIKRFQGKLTREGECLIFTGYKNKKGYGQFSNSYDPLAHRFSWIMHNGLIPKNMFVLHKCDNPPCCEISHLWLGYPADNTKDMISKGRQWDYSSAPKGESSASAKITEIQANKIGQLIANGLTIKEISKQLQISYHIIADIRSRKTWRHVEFKKPIIEKYKKECLMCQSIMILDKYDNSWKKYCSRNCYWDSMKSERFHVICLHCKKEFKGMLNHGKLPNHCRIECFWESMKGKYPKNIKKK